MICGGDGRYFFFVLSEAFLFVPSPGKSSIQLLAILEVDTKPTCAAFFAKGSVKHLVPSLRCFKSHSVSNGLVLVWIFWQLTWDFLMVVWYKCEMNDNTYKMCLRVPCTDRAQSTKSLSGPYSYYTPKNFPQSVGQPAAFARAIKKPSRS